MAASRRPRATSRFSSTTPRQPRAAPGAAEWADRYKGKFDQGWDKLREETFARQKRLGVIPADASSPRDPAFPAWDSVPADLKKLYTRQMEVFAGFRELRLGDRPRRPVDRGPGDLDNTLIIYIWGDNGSSMEGTETGTFNEMTTLNGVPMPGGSSSS